MRRLSLRCVRCVACVAITTYNNALLTLHATQSRCAALQPMQMRRTARDGKNIAVNHRRESRVSTCTSRVIERTNGAQNAGDVVACLIYYTHTATVVFQNRNRGDKLILMCASGAATSDTADGRARFAVFVSQLYAFSAHDTHTYTPHTRTLAHTAALRLTPVPCAVRVYVLDMPLFCVRFN